MKQAYVDDCPYYLDDFLTNMKVVKDRSDRTEEAYFIDIRTFLRYLNVKHHAVPAETPFNKIKIKKACVNIKIGAIIPIQKLVFPNHTFLE